MSAADPTLFRGEEVLDPARTFLCVFDLLEHYRAGAEASGAIPHVRRLADGCRQRGVVVATGHADQVLADPMHPYVRGLRDDYLLRTGVISVPVRA